MKLDYNLASNWKPDVKTLTDADSGMLRYELFPGDICFEACGINFSASWGWVPVLDFARSLFDIATGIEDGCVEKFEFTENNEYLIFNRSSSTLTISASYTEGVAAILLKDFIDITEEFFRRCAIECADAYPAIKSNPAFGDLLNKSNLSVQLRRNSPTLPTSYKS